jgi:hypothetical protein
MRWPIVSALVLGLTAVSAVESFSADNTFYGVGTFAATAWHDDPIWYTTNKEKYDWQEYHVNPIVGRHQSSRWDVWLEGNVGYIIWDDLPDSLELGVSLMNSYDFLTRRGWSLFGEIGAGIGWLSYTPDPHVVDDFVLGFFEYGIGIKARTKQGFVIKIGPRFQHRSGLFVVDAGVNGYGIMFSVSK